LIVSRLSGEDPKAPAAQARLKSGEVDIVASELSERDRAILASFRTVQLLTGEHIERLHCKDLSELSRARRRRDILNRLVRLRILDKLPRRVGGIRAGSAGSVFGLGVIGERLITIGRRSRWRGGIALVSHTLGVSEVFVRVKEVEAQGDIQNVSFVNEPQCWQTIEGDDALSDSWLLKPDALLSFERSGEMQNWFVEVDRGTESASTLRKKMTTYEAAWEAGFNIEGVMPRVWWVEL
jgi:Replication-relaxation